MTLWKDINNVAHIFRQLNANTWEEVFNGKRFATFVYVSSLLSKTVTLFANDRNVYIQLNCVQSTWGNSLSTITQYVLNFGYWTDNNGSNLCSSTTNDSSTIVSSTTITSTAAPSTTTSSISYGKN